MVEGAGWEEGVGGRGRGRGALLGRGGEKGALVGRDHWMTSCFVSGWDELFLFSFVWFVDVFHSVFSVICLFLLGTKALVNG